VFRCKLIGIILANFPYKTGQFYKQKHPPKVELSAGALKQEKLNNSYREINKSQ
jgi:hypothetical protein